MDLDPKQFQKTSHRFLVIEKHLKVIYSFFRVRQGREQAAAGEKNIVT